MSGSRGLSKAISRDLLPHALLKIRVQGGLAGAIVIACAGGSGY